jgi:hypothetical protein
MRPLLLALAAFIASPPAYAADVENRDVAYARCLMQAYERGILEGDAHNIYVVACMRVAGYEPEEGALTGGAIYREAGGG